MQKVWFKNKTYGYGWTPAAWQGWLVLLVYLLLGVGLFVWAYPSAQSGHRFLFTFVLPYGLLTSILLFVCWKTGEKLEWRWGKKDDRLS